MPSNPNYFDVLDFGPDASATDIPKAYLTKARPYHPDSQHSSRHKDIFDSDELLKRINQAHEVLRNAEKRKLYKQSPSACHDHAPTPVVESVGVNISNANPGVTYTGNLIVRNKGGPYAKLKATSDVRRMTVASLRPLTISSQLPLRVEIELLVEQWSSPYRNELTIGLDEATGTVPVTLRLANHQTQPSVHQATQPSKATAKTGHRPDTPSMPLHIIKKAGQYSADARTRARTELATFD